MADTFPLKQAAVHDNNEQMMTILSSAGVNVNEQDGGGYSALSYAVGRQNLDGVRILLKHGANVNIQALNGVSPLYLAAERGNVEIARLLLDRGARVNTVSAKGFTPLMCAIAMPSLAMVNLLLDHGANVNICSGYTGKTPLQVAYQFVEDKLKYSGYAIPGMQSDVDTLLKIIDTIRDHMQHEEMVCPVCLERASGLPLAEHGSTPCCGQFICKRDLAVVRAARQPCPLCRSRHGW